MKPRVWVVCVIGCGSLSLSLFAAEIYPKPSRRKGVAIDANTVIARLDQVLAEEQQLLQAVEEIKRELAIVKVRASHVPSSSVPSSSQ